MRDITQPHGLCSLDPITLGVGALGALGGSLFGASQSGGGAAPTPQAPPPMAPPQKTPPPKQGAQQSSFMGGIPTPPPTSGQKTLLGQ